MTLAEHGTLSPDGAEQPPIFAPSNGRALGIIGRYLAAAAVVCVAQWIPYTGAILMFLFAFVWVALILNAMLIHLTYVAVIGKIPRLWLLLPGLVYGGWVGFQEFQNIQTAQRVRELEASNHIDQPIPPNLDLVFDKDDPYAVAVKKLIVGGRVFAGDFEIQFKPYGCLSEVDKKAGEAIWGHIKASPDYEGGGCLVSRVSPGPHPGLRVRKTVDTGFTATGQRTTYSLEIDASNEAAKAVGQFSSGWFEVISPWPVFFLGCALGDHPAGWFCSYGAATERIHYGVSRQPSFAEWGVVEIVAFAKLLNRPIRQVL
jgi:hypothetical protein